MENFEAIKQRQSRRKYLGTPIDMEKLVVLNDLIQEANEKSGLSISFLQDGATAFNAGKSYGMFNNVQSLILLKGHKDTVNLKEKVGYFGELLVLEATKLGLGTCWVGGTFDKKSLAIQTPGEEIVCVITIGNVEENKSVKEKIISKLAHRKTKTIEEMYTADAKVPDWFLSAMEAVQKAPSAINSQKVMLEYKNDRIKAYVPDTYTFDLIDLGIAKLHFELIAKGTFQLGNHGVFSKG